MLGKNLIPSTRSLLSRSYIQSQHQDHNLVPLLGTPDPCRKQLPACQTQQAQSICEIYITAHQKRTLMKLLLENPPRSPNGRDELGGPDIASVPHRHQQGTQKSSGSDGRLEMVKTLEGAQVDGRDGRLQPDLPIRRPVSHRRTKSIWHCPEWGQPAATMVVILHRPTLVSHLFATARGSRGSPRSVEQTGGSANA